MSSDHHTVVGIYLDLTGGTSLADTRVSLVEATADGTLIMRNPDECAGMRLILNHLDMNELLCLVQALHAPTRRKAA